MEIKYTTPEWKEWAENPLTEAFLKDLHVYRRVMLESFMDASETQDLVRSICETRGICIGIQSIIDQVEDYKKIEPESN